MFKMYISLFLLCVTCQLSWSQPVGIEDWFDVSQNEQQIISSLVKRFAEDKAETKPTRQIRRGNTHFSNPLEENLNIPVVVVYDDVKVVQPRRSKSIVTSTTPGTVLSTSVIIDKNNVESTESTTSTVSTISKEETTTGNNIAKTSSNNLLPQINVTINTENKKELKIEVSKGGTISNEDTITTRKIIETATKKQSIKFPSTAVPPQVRQKHIPVEVVQDINEDNKKLQLKASFDVAKSNSNNTLPQTDVTVITENIKRSKINSSNETSSKEENKETETDGTSYNDKPTKHSDSDKNTNKGDHKNIEDTSLESSTRKSKYIRQKDPVVPIIDSTNFLFPHGKFQYSYEGGDGTKAFENGELKEFDDDRAGEAVVGGFSYKDKEGNDFSISYTADENGYRPVGAHLPTPPPIPPAIARALAYLATKMTPQPATESINETEATTVSEVEEAKT